MLTDRETGPVARRVTDKLEVDAFVEPSDRKHHDRYVHHTHELPDESSEATSRALIRVVPLAYGALLGALADSLLLGLSAGAMLSAAFDLYMKDHSVVRWLSRGLSRQVCPGLARLARALARGIRLLGLPAPTALGRMQCGAPRSLWGGG